MSQKYVIVHFIDNDAVPDDFPASEWPLHITLLANFTIAKPVENLRSELKNYSQQVKPFSIVTVGEALFGYNQDITVSLIQPNAAIKDMHKDLSAIASDLGAVFDEPKFMAEGFRPHATIQINSRLNNNQSVIIDNFTLIDMYPRKDMSRRRIIESFKFEE